MLDLDAARLLKRAGTYVQVLTRRPSRPQLADVRPLVERALAISEALPA